MMTLSLTSLRARIDSLITVLLYQLLLLNCRTPVVSGFDLKCEIKTQNGDRVQRLYDTNKMICCNGSLSPRLQQGRYQDCCLTDPERGVGENYFVDEKQCCGNTVIRNMDPEGRRIDCCDSKMAYIPVFGGLCCNGEYDKNAGEYIRCCSGIQFDVKHKICCGGKIHDRAKDQRCCGQKNFNVHFEECLRWNQVVKSSRVCDNVPYHNHKSICCEGVLHSHVHKNNILSQCCGKKMMNSKHQRCCNGTVLEKNMWCCENGKTQIAFNSEYQKCEEGTVLPKSSSTGFCGSQKYDLNNQYCCGESVLSKQDKCCATEKLADSHICCGKDSQYKLAERAIKKDSPLDNQCCNYYNITTPYCDIQMKCSKGQVMNKSIGYCNNNLFDKTKDLCCKNSVLYLGKKSLGWKCCSSSFHVYDPKKHPIRSTCKHSRKPMKQPQTEGTITQSIHHKGITAAPRTLATDMSTINNSAIQQRAATVCTCIGVLLTMLSPTTAVFL